MEDNTKFCTKCGTKLSTLAAQQTTVNTTTQPQEAIQNNTASSQANMNNAETQNNTQGKANAQANTSPIDTQALQNALQGYWTWLLVSWKSPFKAQKTTKYAGILTLFLESFFFTLGIGHLAQKATSAATNAANSFIGTFSGNTSSNYAGSYSLGIDFYFAIILIILVAAVAMVGITFLIHRAVGGAATETFIDYLNRLAHYSSSILILNIIFFLMALSGFAVVSMLVSAILLLVVAVIWSITIVCGVVVLEKPGQLDRIYGAIIAGVICVIIESIAISLVTSKLGDTAGSFISSLLKGGN
ncbi:hypothetical protein FC81_GL001610 [Liquorilactobacillus capillatus DSM 19910]|uniref:Zinc-ribbon domain-containing protein n=2 Tax=Liquorilactobacillus capillatus TaxID=480931 RepID=A0A0R1LZR0_9LACO|nr:hypothetical protein FC81_GL001610 [Liquorilactobacillus capillatus DSM 19910]